LPVRQAGQSLRNQLDTLASEKAALYVFLPSFAAIIAFLEWHQYFFPTPPTPWLYTWLFGLALVCSILGLRRAFAKAKTLKLGLSGEEAVGQYLEQELRPLGCQVLHDIPFDGFNIDHVVIGPGGVYIIETKTHSKPAKGHSEVKYDGRHVTVNGFKPDRDPIVQAKAAARSLHDLLDSSTGKKFRVKPVVLYPGWWVKSVPSNAEVWVLNEKALPSFIGNAKQTLPPEDVNLVTFHLKRYVIAKDKEKK
jgi:hypothetical protein